MLINKVIFGDPNTLGEYNANLDNSDNMPDVQLEASDDSDNFEDISRFMLPGGSQVACAEDSDGSELSQNSVDERDEGIDPTTDPMFISQAQLFETPSEEEEEEDSDIPRAMYESTVIQHTYISAFIQHAFFGATNAAIRAQLEASRVQLRFAQSL